jgi:hypothetical protein
MFRLHLGHPQTVLIAAISACLITGCNYSPMKPGPASSVKSAATAHPYPPRPTLPPPPVKLFHAANDSFTLVTDPNASDDQIVAILYALRDAARTHTFASLHLPQKAIDARKPIAWFHIYRGPQCAAEKYAPGAPPCGASYHAAGDFTLGSYTDPDWNSGTLLHNTNSQGDGAETPLWNPDAPNR